MADQHLLHTDQLPGRTLLADGREYLFFSGTSYLGIPCNLQFRQYLQQGFYQYGTNYSSSRHSNLKLTIFDEAEAYLAQLTGAEAALTMSSGYLAGQTLVQTLQDNGYFIYAPDTHPALWRTPSDAPPTGITHTAWVEKLCNEVPLLPAKHLVIVCNSLDPLHARNHSFDWVASLPQDKEFTLIIDDSHGLGVTGVDGAGILSRLSFIRQLPHIRVVVVGSLGKAFGIPAGAIFGNKDLIEKLQKSPYFGGASPAIPAYLYAFLQAGSLYSEERKKLFTTTDHFLNQLTHPEIFSFFEHYPVFYTSQKELYYHLLQQGIMISSFRYPTPTDEPITRVVLNSLHTPDDLKQLTESINLFCEKVAI